jgi:hypothetical protein
MCTSSSDLNGVTTTHHYKKTKDDAFQRQHYGNK